MNRIKLSIIVVGSIIALVGFGHHFLVPGTSRSGLIIEANSAETVTRSIELELGNIDYSFGIDFLPPGQSSSGNVTAYLLDAANYDLYTSGIPLNSVDALLIIDNSTRAQYETIVTADIEFYFVLHNNGSDPTYWSYYYAVTPSTYYVSLTMGFAGVFIVLVGLGWFLTGWKRYFAAGLSVNVLLFFIRIFTLSNYSLGLDDIFWDLIHIEFYNDYQYFYLAWVPNVVEGAWPYSAALYYYIYPPLWIYSVSILGNVP
ncbi:MAG: hypothetical protein KAR33_14105, partial [Candidatus Thorarchaeota archaeon]|nr:hypothetical protein [Candidatus Thorarchaeota archaeon]